MINLNFKSVIELVRAFPDEQTCIDQLEQLRWNGVVVSPFDPSSKVYKCKGNRYMCTSTNKYFNVKTSTLFDNTKVDLQKWFLAIFLITAHKKGISSLQLSRDLDVTQKTAWFMLQRIRNCFGLNDVMPDDEGGKMGGEGVVVEVDETYVGGKIKNMSNKKRKAVREAGTDNKIGVMGFLERGGELRLTTMKKDGLIKDQLMKNVTTDSVLMTDAATTYKSIGKQFAFHGFTDHSKSEYVKDGVIHTNSIEGVFSLFDRMVIGIYHSISAKHIQKYLNEHSFRYNNRTMNDCSRFKLMLTNCENRLTYNKLIAKSK